MTEGSVASFTISASPAPSAALTVSVTVSQSGDFASVGPRGVTITSGSATLTVSTTNDSTDEPDGSVTATLVSGEGYTVSSSAGSATVAVADDDDPPPPPPPPPPDLVPESQPTSTDCGLPDDAVTADEVTGWRDALDPVRAAAGVSRWNRVLEALGVDTGTGLSAMTAGQAQAVSDWLNNTRWDRTSRTLAAAADCDGSLPASVPEPDPKPAEQSVPEISVTAGAAVTEGGDASFTVTADPAPKGTVAVTFVAMVTQDGRFTSSDGPVVKSIGTSGSTTFTVPTLNDDRDEADGSITVTLQADTRETPRFTVSATQGSAAVVVSDDDAVGSAPAVTYTEFWAPYLDLIEKVTAERNHPLYSISSAHTDLYDSALLAFGRDVDKASLEPMPVWRARGLAARSGVDIWDEVAPALTDIWHDGPPPPPTPTVASTWPASINLSESVGSTYLTLTDYFAHPKGDPLTFTAALDNPIATITQSGAMISIKPTGKGTAVLTVTAGDGMHSVIVTAGVEAVCSPGSRLSYGSCVSPQVTHTYSGTLKPHPSSPGGPGADGFTSTIRLEEGTSGSLQVRVWVDLGHDNAACRMRGYITIEPQTPGQTIPAGVTATTYGATTSPNSSAGQGWNDATCGNGLLTTSNRNYRLAKITYNLADDGAPGTTFNGAKLVYHDMDTSGSSVVGTHDLVNIDFRDSIATVTAQALTGGIDGNADGDGDASTFTITEGTSGTQTVTLSGEHLVGYFAPRMQDIRKGGHFSKARMQMEHGHAVYWQPSVCAFNKPANAEKSGASYADRTATCDVSWDWKSDGSAGSQGTVKLVWYETDGAGWDRPDVHTTEVNTITMTDAGPYNAITNPDGWDAGTTAEAGNFWVEAVGGQNTATTSLGNVTTIEEGGKFELKVITSTAVDVPVALEVRTASDDSGTSWSAWQNLENEVGYRALAIQEESEWHLYTDNGSFMRCSSPGGFNCFGGPGAWKDEGSSRYVVRLIFVSHDDNFVYQPERYYQFRVKNSTATNRANPILKVTEDDAVAFVVSPQEQNGRLQVYLAKKVHTDITLKLHTQSYSSHWNDWSVIYSAGEYGFKIIDQGCDGGTSDIQVWASINPGPHTPIGQNVQEYLDYKDGRTDKNDARKGEYVIVTCD